MLRTIDGFHQDEVGDWVAELSCLHGQHVRHEPPFQERPWVVTAEGREGRIGTPIECPLCDRFELPEGLEQVRTAGPFDATSVPAGLLGAHRVAERTWGQLEVRSGSVAMELPVGSPPRHLAAGDRQAIPPSVEHRLVLTGPVELAVHFFVLPGTR